MLFLGKRFPTLDGNDTLSTPDGELTPVHDCVARGLAVSHTVTLNYPWLANELGPPHPRRYTAAEKASHASRGWCGVQRLAGTGGLGRVLGRISPSRMLGAGFAPTSKDQYLLSLSYTEALKDIIVRISQIGFSTGIAIPESLGNSRRI